MGAGEAGGGGDVGVGVDVDGDVAGAGAEPQPSASRAPTRDREMRTPASVRACRLVGPDRHLVPWEMVAADPLIGAELGTYRISHVLGEGGMGRVYAAVNPQIAGRVAIKVLSNQDPDLVARFFAEARAINLINHRSIVRVQDLAQLPDGRPYIVMELLEGETLKSVVRRDAPLPIGGVTRVVGQAISALGAAHAIGIVHRDFKSDNIMVLADGSAKVLDFGIAKLSPWLGGGGPRTVTGVRVGTPAYMAPEQIRGDAVDARTDIYAAGVVLFEALTGRRPFLGDNEFELMKAHLELAPPAPSSVRADVPHTLDQVVLQALAKRPEDRFQAVPAMTNALVHVGTLLTADQNRPVRPRPGATLQLAPVAESPRSPSVALAMLAVEPSRLDAPTVATPGRVSRTRVWPLVAIPAAALAAVTAVMLALYARTSEPRAEPATAATPTASTPPVSATAAAAPRSEVVTLPSGAKQLTVPVDVDPTQFDAVAYVPAARAVARKLLDDAELFAITASAVSADGRPSFADGTINTFSFISPSRRRPNGQSSTAVAALCQVSVKVTPTQLVASAPPTTYCAFEPSPPPTCRFADIWARAKAKGAPTGTVALLAYVDHGWTFTIHAVGFRPFSTRFDDHCSGK